MTYSDKYRLSRQFQTVRTDNCKLSRQFQTVHTNGDFTVTTVITVTSFTYVTTISNVTTVNTSTTVTMVPSATSAITVTNVTNSTIDTSGTSATTVTSFTAVYISLSLSLFHFCLYVFCTSILKTFADIFHILMGGTMTNTCLSGINLGKEKYSPFSLEIF